MRLLPRRAFLTSVALVVALVLGWRFPAGAADPPRYVVIVHPESDQRVLSRRFVAEAFLKKTTRWPNGDVIRPVDQAPGAAVRDRFSEDVLRRSVSEVKSYWQQMIFSGRDVPPPELADDEEVLRFVMKNKNAIGYVSGRAQLGETKPVTFE